MNKLREKIDAEFENLDFECDVNSFEVRYKKRRKNVKHTVLFVGIMCLIGISVFTVVAGQRLQQNTTNSIETRGNSFFITAYAAETSASGKVRKKYDITDNDSLIIPEFRLETREFMQGKKTYKSFYCIGNTEIGVNGDNIKILEFSSEISTFCYDTDDTAKNKILVNYDKQFPESNTVEWLLPEEINYWMEKQGEADYEFKFSDLPEDVVTITVVFDDGSFEEKSMALYFNDDGYLVIKCK